MDAKYAIPRVAGHFCAIVPKESSMGYDKSGHHQLRETWKQRPKLHGEDMIRYDPICRCRNYLRTGDGAWNAAFLWISCECSVHLCWVNNGEETPWRSYHLNLFTVQERLQKQTRAQPCLMPAWYGLMSSSSWLQLFITFPLAAACEIWISACLTDIQLPGHRWSTKANSLAKGIITYAKNTLKRSLLGRANLQQQGCLMMMIMKQIEVLYSNLFAKLSTEWKVHDGPNASQFKCSLLTSNSLEGLNPSEGSMFDLGIRHPWGVGRVSATEAKELARHCDLIERGLILGFAGDKTTLWLWSSTCTWRNRDHHKWYHFLNHHQD